MLDLAIVMRRPSVHRFTILLMVPAAQEAALHVSWCGQPSHADGIYFMV